MGWPFGPRPRRAFDPAAVRPAEPTLGVGGRLGTAADFLGLALNEGAAQLATTAAAAAPDGWGFDPRLQQFARGRRAANDALIGDRVERSGAPLAQLPLLDPTDPAVRMATFQRHGVLNPDAGGVAGWRDAGAARAQAWNADAEARGLAPLTDPLRIEDPGTRRVAGGGGGLMFGRRRR